MQHRQNEIRGSIRKLRGHAGGTHGAAVPSATRMGRLAWAMLFALVFCRATFGTAWAAAQPADPSGSEQGLRAAQDSGSPQDNGNQQDTQAPNSTASKPDSQANGSASVEEVVVTARRRNENIERVPLAMTAFNPADLSQRSINTESDLQRSIPGLTVRATQDQNQLNFAIRGQTVDGFTSSKPAVLSYIDEVQFNTASASSFFDLNSVQVLKGPQGTLFGRNTTGGAVLFTTTKPGTEFGGYLTLRGGNNDQAEARGAVDIPIVDDRVLLRLAGDVDYRKGYIHDTYFDNWLGTDQRQAGRATLVVKPVTGLENTTVVEFDNIGGNETGGVIGSAYPCGSAPPLNSKGSCLFGPTLDAAIKKPGAWATYLAAHPFAYPGGLQEALAAQLARGPYITDGEQPSVHRAHNYFLTNTTVYEVSPDLQFKNIAGVSRSITQWGGDDYGIPFAILTYRNPITGDYGDDLDDKEGSEELQAQGKAFDRHLTYIVGLYYSADNHVMTTNASAFDLSPVIAPTPANHKNRDTDYSKAVFFQGTYDLSSLTGIQGLSFTGGFRYTWEQSGKHELPGSSEYHNPDPVQGVRYSAPSWQDGLEYQVDPALLLYVTQRGSFRSPGFNDTSPAVNGTAAQGGNLFLAETTYDVEVGAKFQGTPFGLPARLNVALYNQWVKNSQRFNSVTLPSGQPVGLTVNVPKVEVAGAELDGSINPLDWLETGVSLSYTNAQYTSNQVTIFGNTTSFGPYADTPRYSGTAYAQVTLPTADRWGRMTVRADVYGQSPQYYSNLGYTLAPQTRLPSYELVNLRYDWHDAWGTNLTLSGYATNLLDRTYYVGGLAEGTAFGVNGVVPGVPRMYGAEVSYKF
jgi:iron complex outermembrane receptor protein